jgi:predicted nucleic acid-binding protein
MDLPSLITPRGPLAVPYQNYAKTDLRFRKIQPSESSLMKLGNNTFLKRLKTDPLPENNILFWDTSLPASAIFQHEKSDQRKAAIDFIDRLIKEKTYVAFSSILFDEFVKISMRNELMKSLGTRSQADKVLANKDEKYILPHVKDIQKNMTALNDILSKFKNNLKVIFPSEPGIISKALEIKCQYKLEDSDSIHIATMLFGVQRDIACFDRKDFGKVDGLNLWCMH